jgi:hypothetical protein
MKQTLFYLICLLVVAMLIAGFTGTQAQKTVQPTSQTAVSQSASQATVPTGTATISTPSVVTVGAPPTAAAPATVTPIPSKTPKPTATQKYAPSIKSANYAKTIDNPYFPLTPGTTYLFNGTKDKSQLINEVVVTKKTRKIMGVTCVEVDSTVTVDDNLAEKTIGWYSQDKQGNVWFFGEDAKQYSTSGKVTGTAGTFLAGSNSALPGIVMQANPTTDLSYRQDSYKGHAEDMAQVLSLTESVNVTYGSYDNVLMTKEWSPLDAKVVENKWYAKGVGLVMSKTVQGGNEEMQLTSVTK